jgi:hypothetical protein
MYKKSILHLGTTKKFYTNNEAMVNITPKELDGEAKYFRLVSGPNSKKCEVLQLVLNDFEMTDCILKETLKIDFAGDESIFFFINTMLTSAITIYARSFTNNKSRNQHKIDINLLLRNHPYKNDALHLHKDILIYRDKIIAHPDANTEQVIIFNLYKQKAGKPFDLKIWYVKSALGNNMDFIALFGYVVEECIKVTKELLRAEIVELLNNYTESDILPSYKVTAPTPKL